MALTSADLLVFYFNLPAGVVAILVLVLTRIPERHGESDKLSFRTIVPRLDVLGFALFAPAAVMFLLALDYGGKQFPWNSATVIDLFVGAGVTFFIFLGWEHHQGANAMIPLQLVTKREVFTSAAAGSLLLGGLMLVGYFVPIYYQAVGGVSPLASGLYTLPSILSSLVLVVTSGILGK